VSALSGPQEPDEFGEFFVLFLPGRSGSDFFQREIECGPVPGLQPPQFTHDHGTVPDLEGELFEKAVQDIGVIARTRFFGEEI